MSEPKQHIHGGAPLHAFHRLGIPPQKVIDFSVNVSPLGPPRILFKEWEHLSGEIANYPSMDGDGIADFYMQRFALKRENILPGNGSTECIYLVPRALKLKSVAIVTPSFHDYERACLLAGARILELPLQVDNGFSPFDFEFLGQALEMVDAIVLGSPNNPTNTLFDRETILALADRYPQKWILVDEAFIQFVENATEQSLINTACLRKNLLVFNSLTKFYDLPGIRLGCVIGHAETLNALKQYKEPWTINGIAEKAAQLMIDCQDYDQLLNQLIKKERERFFSDLADLKGIKLFKSSTNFILGQWQASENLDDLLKMLLSSGFHIRDCRNFKKLEDNYFRFAIRKGPDNTRLIALIQEAVNRFLQ